MVSRPFREGLADEGDGKKEPAEREASPLRLSLASTRQPGASERPTASGCFQGQERLLSIAPIEMEGRPRPGSATAS